MSSPTIVFPYNQSSVRHSRTNGPVTTKPFVSLILCISSAKNEVAFSKILFLVPVHDSQEKVIKNKLPSVPQTKTNKKPPMRKLEPRVFLHVLFALPEGTEGRRSWKSWFWGRDQEKSAADLRSKLVQCGHKNWGEYNAQLWKFSWLLTYFIMRMAGQGVYETLNGINNSTYIIIENRKMCP